MATPDRRHAALDSLVYEQDTLTWGGRKITEIADEVGQTPFYCYDLARMAEKIAALRAVVPSDLQIHYAMKANPMPEVVEHMAGLVDGLDVASVGELQVALRTGVNPRDISFAGPGKQDHELSAAAEAGITVNLESYNEMRRLAKIAERMGIAPDVAIRVNPTFELKTAGMKMGGRPSQFGVDAERVPAMMSELEKLPLNFRGFHVFAGSQNLRIDAVEETLQKTVDLVLQLADSSRLNISFVNLGGGLGIPYFPNESPLSLPALELPYASAVRRLRKALGKIDVIAELGRFLVGESGIYVCKVIDIKESRGVKFAICDGGLHHHLAASGNFGQILRKNYPVAPVHRTSIAEEIYVVGPLCTPLDILADKTTISRLEVGSLLAVLQSGAYGFSASPINFLSHPVCKEIVV